MDKYMRSPIGKEYDYNPNAELLTIRHNGVVFKEIKGSRSHFAAVELVSSGMSYNLIIDSKLNNE